MKYFHSLNNDVINYEVIIFNTVISGYNDHGYYEIKVITNTFQPSFWSQMTVSFTSMVTVITISKLQRCYGNNEQIFHDPFAFVIVINKFHCIQMVTFE